MSSDKSGWHTYAVPVRIEREGIVYIRARSSDEAVMEAETLDHDGLDNFGVFENRDVATITGVPEIDDEEE